MPPPRSSSTTIVRSGRASSGPMTRPVVSCRNVRSPSSATVGPSCASAAPTAVEIVPSMPCDAPVGPHDDAVAGSGGERHVPHRVGRAEHELGALGERARPARGPAASRPGRCRGRRRGRPGRPCRRSVQRRSHSGSGRKGGRRADARGPSPRRRSTAGRARPPARTRRRAGSASSRATARCSVGRPRDDDLRGRERRRAEQPRAGADGAGHGADDGSATTGTPTSSGGPRAPRSPASGPSGPAAAARPRPATWQPRSTAAPPARRATQPRPDRRALPRRVLPRHLGGGCGDGAYGGLRRSIAWRTRAPAVGVSAGSAEVSGVRGSRNGS
jgi:hypothetical protein